MMHTILLLRKISIMQNFENHILIPIDFSEQSLIALKQSYNIARFKNSDLTLLHVIDVDFIDKFKSIFNSSDDYERMINDAKEKLEKLRKDVISETGLAVNIEVKQGKIYDEILNLSRELNAAFIIMGTNGPDSLAKKFIGSNAIRVINDAECPVITIKGKQHREGCKRIILPLDISEESRDKVSMAIELAQYFGSEIAVLSIYDVDDEFIKTKLLRQLQQVEDYIAAAGVKCSCKMIHSNDISDTVLTFSAGADGDLVMIMSQEQKGITDWFVGTEAQQIINNSEIPVCSVKPIARKDTQDFVIFNI